MDRYIGMDVHMKSCTIAVVGPSGRRIGSQVVETSGQAVVEAIRAIRSHGTCAWRRARRVRGCTRCSLRTCRSWWLQPSPRAAARRAMRSMRSVWPRPCDLERSRCRCSRRQVALHSCGLGRTYSTLARDVVRTQNRLKNVYRSRGVRVPGKSVYSATGREEFLTKLPAPARTAAALLYAELDALRTVKREAYKQLVSESHRHPISRMLETCPGLGEIRVAQRFPWCIHRPGSGSRTSRQFWSC